MTGDPTVKIARNLTQILRLHAELEERAVDLANSSLMPGGDAMAELAPTGNLDVWAGRQSLDEDRGVGTKRDHSADADDDGEWTAFQTLRFWSEAWRTERGADWFDLVPTIATEANFIRDSLAWAWENEAHWNDFVDDVGSALARLENVLRQGTRPAFRGVPCPDKACEGTKLVRYTVRTGSGYALTDWFCRRCKLKWDEDAYARIETLHRQATEQRGHFLNLDGDVWVSIPKARELTGRTARQIWEWITRGSVTARKVERAGTYVHLGELRAREELRSQRAARVLARRTTGV